MNCCYNCKDRAVGCHSKCEKYAEFDQGRKEELAKRQSVKPLDHFHLESVIRSRAVGAELERMRRKGNVR